METKAIELANKALSNPSLLINMPEDTFFKFVIGIAKYDKSLAMEVESLKPFTSPDNKVLFWEVVGILMPQENYN
jgi:hypothetical protein